MARKYLPLSGGLRGLQELRRQQRRRRRYCGGSRLFTFDLYLLLQMSIRKTTSEHIPE